MKKLLLTGFEPFLDYTVNPTMKIVEALDGTITGNYRIVGKIMPVDFNLSGGSLIDFIDEEKPDAVISLGLAAGRYKITPERIALNVKDGDADNEGNKPVDEPIRKDGEAAYLSTLPVRKMVDRLLANGLPAAISNTAGAYLCNNVMYEGLHYAKINKPGLQTGFIHIPASHELAIQHGRIPSWSHEDLLKGIQICIKVLNET
ncbi:pyrrolidone-carboxylate peptidase [Planococcus antarcticus DSM 14505]|uniref:Pyrrolidone-carboxylate peptidase n=1 Tax=Planococcus antarcticus DSM 14505 TaxID=1185653 RepID=A0A1C7DFN5_9BACL|nr:pyroglutamyl-peptidase I [Planococcus antarcticus]ANU10265.1 pyroglutamyl-peptidase I [Planococcus antarcticus DSM 14505]EIM07172.1 pyrrolidone-carboxylate peptidase [Planococcus antarcticus DSM 14505]